MQDRRFLHLGRMLLAVPADAELVEFSATIGGVDLEELELGDSSPEAGYLAWMQVSEQAREVSGFDEVTVDERFWIAFYGVSEPRVIALAQCEDSGLLLSASATEWEDAVPRVHDLRRRYALSSAEPAAAFGLGRGLLELPPERPEEVVAQLARAQGWSLSLTTCAVAIPSPSNYEGLRAGLLASATPERRPFVHAAPRSCGSLQGEELHIELLGEELPTYQMTWRTPGQAHDPANPEIELELTVRGATLERAQDLWRQVIEGSRLALEQVQ
ncbi:MAG: hypothetical protein R6X02_04855 [Enhygromyxa sp.]